MSLLINNLLETELNHPMVQYESKKWRLMKITSCDDYMALIRVVVSSKRELKKSKNKTTP